MLGFLYSTEIFSAEHQTLAFVGKFKNPLYGVFRNECNVCRDQVKWQKGKSFIFWMVYIEVTNDRIPTKSCQKVKIISI
jgi:hypothetical protein